MPLLSVIYVVVYTNISIFFISINISIFFFLLFAGISELAKTPEKASDYIYPLLSFAAQHIPKNKHQETPLYILCTAGMRILPEK